MSELNVHFNDAEMEAIRAAAQESEQSLHDYVHDAAVQRAGRHNYRVAAAAELVAKRSAELNRRLRGK